MWLMSVAASGCSAPKGLGVKRQGAAELGLGVHDVAEFVRQAAEVAQVVGEVGMVGAELALACLDQLFEVVALGAQVVQAGHRAGGSFRGLSPSVAGNDPGYPGSVG